MRTIAVASLVVCGSLALASPGWTQEHSPRSKYSVDVKQPLAELATPLAPMIVELCDDQRLCTLATVVSSQGLLVTKASEIKEKEQLVCKLFDGRQFQPTLVSEDIELDLALLKIEAADLAPVELTTDSAVSAGSFVVCVGPNANPIGFGVVEVDPRAFRFPRQRKAATYGYLGIQSHTEQGSGKLIVDQVEPNEAARRAGMRKGDVIRSINGQAISSRDQLVQALRQHKAGETVEIVLERSNLEMTVRPKLGKYRNEDPLQQWGGGPFNERRYGFADVIVHDTVIPPNQCGAPLLDSQGRVVGINIARALRVATYAIPAAKIAAFIEPHELSPSSGESQPSEPPSDKAASGGPQLSAAQ